MGQKEENEITIKTWRKAYIQAFRHFLFHLLLEQIYAFNFCSAITSFFYI